ncbi:MAG TPA: hypothetical protein IAC14_07895 [Candidatus Scybalomonas excrementigallinarum]|nr:hypothetical protein [Candidatus Scybalomonas excrementigallinarum]
MKNFKIEQLAKKRWFYKYEKKNKRGENLIIEVCKVECDFEDKSSIPSLWYKHGWIKKKFASYWSISTYIDDGKGNCLGVCNPQHTKGQIDFDWILESTDENKEKLLKEVVKRFNNR